MLVAINFIRVSSVRIGNKNKNGCDETILRRVSSALFRAAFRTPGISIRKLFKC